MPPCFTLSIVRYWSRVSGAIQGKIVAPSPIHWCSSYWKGSLQVGIMESFFVVLPDPLWLGVALLFRVPSMGQIELFKNYLHTIGPWAQNKLKKSTMQKINMKVQGKFKKKQNKTKHSPVVYHTVLSVWDERYTKKISYFWMKKGSILSRKW